MREAPALRASQALSARSSTIKHVFGDISGISCHPPTRARLAVSYQQARPQNSLSLCAQNLDLPAAGERGTFVVVVAAVPVNVR